MQSEPTGKPEAAHKAPSGGCFYVQHLTSVPTIRTANVACFAASK